MKKKVLITGVNGFIGRALWQFIEKKINVDVYGIAVKPRYTNKRIFTCDLTNEQKIFFY